MIRLLTIIAAMMCSSLLAMGKTSDTRPNIVFCIADDWGWPHSPLYGDQVVKTPTLQRIAANGVLFNHAFVSSPSCTPSRNAALTGQYHWRLTSGANLWSHFPKGVQTFPLILTQHGYHVGSFRKAFGPGVDRSPSVSGKKYASVDAFFKARPKDKPFCFWFGSSDPHRSYKVGSGIKSGMDPAKVQLPPYYPDHPSVRSDICDYYFEVQRFDREVGELLDRLKQSGELDNTLVVMTGDHGWPFPRGKSNLYDIGARVPLAMQWGDKLGGKRRIDDFVSFVDFAPTFLELAGVDRPDDMSGRSLLPLLLSQKSGQVEPSRSHVIYGKERHVPCQEKGTIAAPCRAIRNHKFLYIHNFFPDRWPVGAPEAEFRSNWADCDNGPSKSYILDHRVELQSIQAYELCFAKRPQDELYDVKNDPWQIHNLAADPKHAETLKQLRTQLMQELQTTGDLRVQGKGDIYESFPYTGKNKRSKK
ncbi:sulfatase [Verrucomicrobiaceae bacterium N1E253]|uniref:Sulfatase n=1 Tax=Oceaniferula marina TaxID=2748318 RepID=A0A851GP09_9BACT|nr:sulfatase [Oceaniferula marina]NWK57601.1 sulfatase [Oceaniferula marina]